SVRVYPRSGSGLRWGAEDPMARRAAAKDRYQPHPLLAREKSMRAKVEADTGKSWGSLLALAKRMGEEKPRALRERLVSEHGMKPMAAAWIAHETISGDPTDYGDPLPMVDALYAGDRAALRPLHEALVDEFQALGADVVVTACKTMVPVYRKHVIADLR